MRQFGNYTPAFCDELPVGTLLEVFALIYKAHAMPGRQLNYVDPLDNVSYCASIKDQALAVSVVDYGSLPNASLLPVLSARFGEPDRMLSKPWFRDEEFTFFVMYWDSFNLESILN